MILAAAHPFGLATVTAYGSPSFTALILDDEAAVALTALTGLAARMGLAVPPGLSEALTVWDNALPALTALVSALAGDDIAIGHRGDIVPTALLTPALLLPGTRQILRLREQRTECLPVTVQAAAGGIVRLAPQMRAARANLCLAAVLGRALYRAEPDAAQAAIAGWALALELVMPQGNVSHAPGTLALGPYLVPASCADLGVEAVLGLMGRRVLAAPLSHFAQGAAASLATLSQGMLLTPGDVILMGPDAAQDWPTIGELDVIEAVAPGFGRLRLSLQ